MTPNPDAAQPAQRLATGLAGPVDLELPKAVEQLPGRNALPGLAADGRA